MKSKISINETIFVAGASGMAGSAICRSLRNKGYGCKDKGGKLLTPTRKDLDLLSYESVINWFDVNKPTVVIIAAAKVGGVKHNNTHGADFIYENLNPEFDSYGSSILRKSSNIGVGISKYLAGNNLKIQASLFKTGYENLNNMEDDELMSGSFLDQSAY